MAKKAKNLPPGIRYTTDSAGRERLEVRVKFRRDDGTLADVSRFCKVGESVGDAKVLQRRLLAEASSGGVKPLRDRRRTVPSPAAPAAVPPLTLSEAVERYLVYSETTAKNRSIAHKRLLARSIAKALGPGLPLPMLTRERLVEYRIQRQEEGRAGQTINNALRLVQHMLNVGADEGWPGATDDLAGSIARVRPVKLEPGEGRRQRVCTDDEHKRLRTREAYPAELRDLWPIVVTALHMGSRAGELRTLKKSQVTFKAGAGDEAGSITWKVTKNGKADCKPFTAIGSVLREAIRRSPSEYVFPSYSARSGGAAPYHVSVLSHLFTTLVAALGIKPDVNGEPLVFHSLRHSAITRIDDATGDRGAASDLANHSDALTTRRYLHEKEERLRAAMAQAPFWEVGDKPVPLH